MQVELNQDGTRNTQYRPRILLEEQTYNNVYYNPHDSHNHGLYLADHHLHQCWPSHTADHVNKIVQGGRVHNVRPPDHTLQDPRYQIYSKGAFKGTGKSNFYRRLHAL